MQTRTIRTTAAAIIFAAMLALVTMSGSALAVQRNHGRVDTTLTVTGTLAFQNASDGHYFQIASGRQIVITAVSTNGGQIGRMDVWSFGQNRWLCNSATPSLSHSCSAFLNPGWYWVNVQGTVNQRTDYRLTVQNAALPGILNPALFGRPIVLTLGPGATSGGTQQGSAGPASNSRQTATTIYRDNSFVYRSSDVAVSGQTDWFYIDVPQYLFPNSAYNRPFSMDTSGLPQGSTIQFFTQTGSTPYVTRGVSESFRYFSIIPGRTYVSVSVPAGTPTTSYSLTLSCYDSCRN
jgi:hypothetical protein